MIHFADDSTKQAVRDMWKICFGDPDAYMNIYFNHKYRNENTLIYIQDQKPVASLQMLFFNFTFYFVLTGYLMEIVGFWRLGYFVRSALFTFLTSEWRSESLFIHRYVPETDTPANMSGQNAALDICVAKSQHSISKVMATACMANA